jgi:competence protein ComGC
MKLQTISKDKGLTLIEIIIFIFIFSSLILIGLSIEPNIYNKKILEKEHDILVTILLRARNYSMNNIESKAYGIHLEDDSYVLFSEIPYHKNNPNNEFTKRNENIVISSPDLSLNNNQIEIIFFQLSGEPNQVGQIELKENNNYKYINIYKSGLIDW